MRQGILLKWKGKLAKKGKKTRLGVVDKRLLDSPLIDSFHGLKSRRAMAKDSADNGSRNRNRNRKSKINGNIPRIFGEVVDEDEDEDVKIIEYNLVLIIVIIILLKIAEIIMRLEIVSTALKKISIKGEEEEVGGGANVIVYS